MADWSRIVNTTIAEYMRGAEKNILRNRKLLALMQSRGRISFNHGGTQMDWKVEYKRAPVQGFADMDVLTFARRDRWKTAVLPYRGYAATDMMTKMERLKNKSTEAIIKVYDEIVPRLVSDIEERFGDEMYIDGNATGNTNRIHGIESFMGNSGAAAAGYIGSPSDTYAGLSTVLGDYGGDWSVNGSGDVEWPTGTGDEEYDFWSPLIVDYTDASWTATTDTWPNTCKEALRYGIVKGRKNRSTKGKLDLILLENELYRQLLDSLDPEERAVITRGGNAKVSTPWASATCSCSRAPKLLMSTAFLLPWATAGRWTTWNCVPCKDNSLSPKAQTSTLPPKATGSR